MRVEKLPGYLKQHWPAIREQLLSGTYEPQPVRNSYFGFCETPSVLRRLDQWIRHRLRAMIWKQWKRGTARFRNLRQRNIGTDLAATTAGSPHGPWRLANSPALSLAFPIAYFDALELPRFWAELAQPN